MITSQRRLAEGVASLLAAVNEPGGVFSGIGPGHDFMDTKLLGAPISLHELNNLRESVARTLREGSPTDLVRLAEAGMSAVQFIRNLL